MSTFIINVKEGETQVLSNNLKFTMKDGQIIMDMPNPEFSNWKPASNFETAATKTGFFDMKLFDGTIIRGMRVIHSEKGTFISPGSTKGKSGVYFDHAILGTWLNQFIKANQVEIIKQLENKTGDKISQLISEFMLTTGMLIDDLYAFKANHAHKSPLNVTYELTSKSNLVRGIIIYQGEKFEIIEQNPEKLKVDGSNEPSESAKIVREGGKVIHVYHNKQWVGKNVNGSVVA